MPVPKRKVSKARRDQRSACKHIKPKPFVYCPNNACKSEPLLPHMACPRCGFYRNRKVMQGEIDKEVGQEHAQLAAVSAQQVEHSSQSEEAQESNE